MQGSQGDLKKENSIQALMSIWGFNSWRNTSFFLLGAMNVEDFTQKSIYSTQLSLLIPQY
jgi:hypothetical protein